MYDIIKQKIENGQGKIQLQEHGLINAAEYAENNHPNWNQTTKDDFQSRLNQIKIDCNFGKPSFNINQYKQELEQLNVWLYNNGIAQNPDWQEWANDPIVWQPKKDDYKLINIVYGQDENGNQIIIDGDLSLKTDNDKKIDSVKKFQDIWLNRLKNINIAIASQQATNELLKADNEPEVYTITKQQIKDIGQFSNHVATFLENFDPDEYTLEEIDENIFNHTIEIPSVLQDFI